MKTLSIRTRLIAFNTLATIVILLSFTLFSYWALVSILDDANNQFLADEIRVLRNIMLKHPENSKAIEQEIDWIPEELSDAQYHYYARIFDENNKLVMQTEGMNKHLAGAKFPEPTPINETPYDSEIWHNQNGKSYLIMSALATLGQEKKPKRLIEIALDISPQKAIVAEYQTILFGVFILGALAASIISILVARKSLRAIDEMTNHAELITIENLNNPLYPQEWPKELHRLVVAFNNMLLRIETAFNKLSQFSTELAHELRTPLNNLIVNSEVVLSKNRSLESYKDCIASNLEEYQQLSRMMENILFLAQVEHHQSELQFKTMHLQREFQAIAEFYEALAEERQVKIHYDAHNLLLYAEPVLIKRMLSNLVSNAIKFMPQGGVIHLSARNTAKNKIAITVQDNGIGIAKDKLTLIFDRFYKNNPQENLSPLGIGLGLSIVKSIVELHHGQITVDSFEGQGTKFTIIL